MEYFTPIKKACELAGSLTAFARVVGVKPPTAHEWLTGRRPIPPLRCVVIEAAFSSAITRPELRPLDWYLLWPELIGAPGTPTLPDREVM